MLLFFFNDTAPPEIYPLSLHVALRICDARQALHLRRRVPADLELVEGVAVGAGHLLQRLRQAVADALRLIRGGDRRSEEHTSELQSRQYLVCRLLLDKKTTPLNKCTHF